MANPEAIDWYMPGLLEEANDVDRADRERAAHRARVLISSGILAVCTAASVVIYIAANPSGVAPAHDLAWFLLFLIGVWLALLALVAEQFPRAARIGVAIARALQDYLFGGN